MFCRFVPVCLALVICGCGDSNRSANDVDAALEKLNRSEAKDIKSAAAGLEKALEKDPDHIEGWKALSQAVQYLARHPAKKEPVEPLFHKSANLVRRALQVKPSVVDDDPDFGHFVGSALYNDGCAFAREKKVPEALASLREAITHGFSQMDLLESGDDLALIRKDPEFADFLDEAREKIQAATEKEVSRLLAQNDPFKFDFNVQDVSGKKLSKADYAGKVLIVDIWGTWCPPCKMEIPHFIALDKEYRERGLEIVGLNSEGETDDDAAKEVKEFCKKEGMTYPCALIPEEFTERIPKFEGFPTTLFLDRSGKVRLKVTGYHDLWFLRTAVEKLLNE